ncbi:MAG TPA: SPFH domain-containing protein [Chloroflexia bacterium]|nr:SPFH domain-containing protein [Chloroflexia bacterium]
MAGRKHLPQDSDPDAHHARVARPRMPGRGINLLIVAGGVVAAVGCVMTLLLGQFFHRVDPGVAAVKIDYGAGTTAGKPAVISLQTGQFIFFNGATERIAEYPIAQQSLTMVQVAAEGQVKGDDSVKCQDIHGIPVRLDSTTLWRVDSAHVGDLYLLHPNTPVGGHEGSDISSTVVRREVRNALTLACSQYTYDAIFSTKRGEISTDVERVLQPNLAESFIILDKFLLGEVHLEEQQQQAISAVASAQQAALKAGYDKQQAENVAAGRVATADGDKKVAILKAEGDAEAIRVINEQLSRSPAYIQYYYLQKWNGVLPSTMLGAGGATPVIPVGAGSLLPAAAPIAVAEPITR